MVLKLGFAAEETMFFHWLSLASYLKHFARAGARVRTCFIRGSMAVERRGTKDMPWDELKYGESQLD